MVCQQRYGGDCAEILRKCGAIGNLRGIRSFGVSQGTSETQGRSDNGKICEMGFVYIHSLYASSSRAKYSVGKAYAFMTRYARLNGVRYTIPIPVLSSFPTHPNVHIHVYAFVSPLPILLRTTAHYHRTSSQHDRVGIDYT